MKRFSLTGQPSRLTEVENGEWVRWEDVLKVVVKLKTKWGYCQDDDYIDSLFEQK